jgi:hypothetical protein
MGDENPPRDEPRDEEDGEPDQDPVWKVEGEASMDSLLGQTSPEDARAEGEGMMIYTDEHGRRRRIPAERGALSRGELRAASNALQADLGAAPVDYARMAAIERLTELRASGKMSEEDFLREKKRLENYRR